LTLGVEILDGTKSLASRLGRPVATPIALASSG
jgi:hypothetical protein